MIIFAVGDIHDADIQADDEQRDAMRDARPAGLPLMPRRNAIKQRLLLDDIS